MATCSLCGGPSSGASYWDGKRLGQDQRVIEVCDACDAEILAGARSFINAGASYEETVAGYRRAVVDYERVVGEKMNEIRRRNEQ